MKHKVQMCIVILYVDKVFKPISSIERNESHLNDSVFLHKHLYPVFVLPENEVYWFFQIFILYYHAILKFNRSGQAFNLNAHLIRPRAFFPNSRIGNTEVAKHHFEFQQICIFSSENLYLTSLLKDNGLKSTS
jgi:hypothetical protein